jgi:hypothetical protein
VALRRTHRGRYAGLAVVEIAGGGGWKEEEKDAGSFRVTFVDVSLRLPFLIFSSLLV